METTAKRCKGGAEEDRLSSLPDELLHRIMFGVATRVAVRTCVLSRRWRHVWSSCPCLHFGEVHFPRKQVPDPGPHIPFMNFVDRALFFNEATTLTRLSLSTGEASDMTRVRSWIYAGIKRKVRDLLLIIKQKEQFDQDLYLPTSFFHLRSLEKLVFVVLHPQPLYWPRTVSTMALEELTLYGFRFTDNGVGEVISSSCPRLKVWILDRCTGLRRLDVNCPNLETFLMEQIRGLRDLVVSAPSLTKMTIIETFMHAGEGVSTSLEISAPKLCKFLWVDNAVHRYKTNCKMYPSLACVRFRSLGGRDLLLSLGEARYLMIECFSLSSCLVDGPLPGSSYQNLEVLQLQMDSNMLQVTAAMQISLRCFSHLKTLQIRNVRKGEHRSNSFTRASTTFKVHDFSKLQVPSLGQLMEVAYSHFTGSLWELDYIKCILEAAPKLQMITAAASDSIPTNTFAQIVKTLQELPAASPHVKFRFKQHGRRQQHHGGH